jgi:hypothetical protein
MNRCSESDRTIPNDTAGRPIGNPGDRSGLRLVAVGPLVMSPVLNHSTFIPIVYVVLVMRFLHVQDDACLTIYPASVMAISENCALHCVPEVRLK